MPAHDFGAKDLVRLTGVPYQTLDRWIDAGIVTCQTPAEGTGSRRRFSFRDVVFAILARTLKDHQLPMPAVKGILDAIRPNWLDDDPAHAGFLIVKLWQDASQAVWFPDGSRLVDYVSMLDSMALSQPWTGVSLLVDVSFLAADALSQIRSAPERGA